MTALYIYIIGYPQGGGLSTRNSEEWKQFPDSEFRLTQVSIVLKQKSPYMFGHKK